MRLLPLLFLMPAAAFALPQAPLVEVLDATVEAVPAGNTTRVTARLMNTTSNTVAIQTLGSPLAKNSRLILYGKDADGFTSMSEQTMLDIPPGETLIVPNVLEWRLESLEYGLTQGTEIPLTLTFPNGSSRTYKAQVK